MQSIEEALQEVRALHEQVTQRPAPEIAPQAFLPFPPGLDPVAFAIEEVERLKQIVEVARTAPLQGPQWVPPADVHAGDNSVCFTLEIPGVARDELDVRVVGAELVVRGRRAPVERDGRPVLVERHFGVFERRFPLPGWCSPDTIEARYEQGLLELRVQRADRDDAGQFRVSID